MKEAKITKTLLSHILTTKLGIDKETYQKMRIKEVFKTDKDEIIVQFSDPENVGYIYSLTPKLDKNDKISFCEYIPAQFFKRHREINAICKQFRENNFNTHVRFGNKDYNMYVKEKNDTTSWSNLNPYKLHEEITEFEIGKIPKNLASNKRSRPSDEQENYVSNFARSLANEDIEQLLVVESQTPISQEMEMSNMFDPLSICLEDGK